MDRVGAHASLERSEVIVAGEAAGFSLLFAQRPDAAQVQAHLGAGGLLPLAGGHVDAGAGACELIVAGLAFDLAGLAPARTAPMPGVRHWHGIAPVANAEPVVLTCGAHIASGGHLLPVVRAMCAAAAWLAALPGCTAVVWHPAATATSADMFARLVAGWIEGGAFPVFALTGVADGAAGMVSDGLAFFTGQEIRIDPGLGADRNRVGKLSARVIHSLVGAGPLIAPQRFDGPDGEPLMAEPIEQGRVVRVWRPHAG